MRYRIKDDDGIVLATADSIPELFNAVFTLAERERWGIYFKRPEVGELVFSDDGLVKVTPLHDLRACSERELTLTPPPKDEWQEWRERRPEKPSLEPHGIVYGTFLQIEEYMNAIDQWLSEMPERG